MYSCSGKDQKAREVIDTLMYDTLSLRFNNSHPRYIVRLTAA